jgi:hypothetical protein
MKFSSREERIAWLKKTAIAIKGMEKQRMTAVMEGEFSRAYSLLKGIKFARSEFQKQSRYFRRAVI